MTRLVILRLRISLYPDQNLRLICILKSIGDNLLPRSAQHLSRMLEAAISEMDKELRTK